MWVPFRTTTPFALACSASWHFSSPLFLPQRTKLGGKETFTKQLDAFGVAARTLAQRTDELAL